LNKAEGARSKQLKTREKNIMLIKKFNLLHFNQNDYTNGRHSDCVFEKALSTRLDV
jgi:hypothetical protein